MVVLSFFWRGWLVSLGIENCVCWLGRVFFYIESIYIILFFDEFFCYFGIGVFKSLLWVFDFNFVDNFSNVFMLRRNWVWWKVNIFFLLFWVDCKIRCMDVFKSVMVCFVCVERVICLLIVYFVELWIVVFKVLVDCFKYFDGRCLN